MSEFEILKLLFDCILAVLALLTYIDQHNDK